MSWHYLQEGEAASWEEDSLDGAPSALLSLVPMHETSCSLGSETGCSSPSLSGMTSAPLTGRRGEDTSMSLAVASHARTLAQPERAQASTASGQGSGERWRASFTMYDRATSSWRTAQCSLLGDSDEYSETWPRWGSMRNGECSERGMPVRRTRETASGSSRLIGSAWPTPRAADASMGSVIVEDRLLALVETGKPATRKDGGEYQVGLREMVAARQMFATPTATANQLSPSMMKHPGCRAWRVPTPAATDWKGSSKAGQRRGQLTDPAMGAIPPGGKLNPQWVAWLMGWPIGWGITT